MLIDTWWLSRPYLDWVRKAMRTEECRASSQTASVDLLHSNSRKEEEERLPRKYSPFSLVESHKMFTVDNQVCFKARYGLDVHMEYLYFP